MQNYDYSRWFILCEPALLSKYHDTNLAIENKPWIRLRLTM